ncbi:hypothetical protein CHARACLAT_003721, partial [Characodon lateralis]|nr:hypothetical protein [Characodon lateralis]
VSRKAAALISQECPSIGPNLHGNPFHSSLESAIDRWDKLSILPARLSEVKGHREAGAYLQQSTCKRGGVHPGQVAIQLQSNTETHRMNNHAHTHLHLREI